MFWRRIIKQKAIKENFNSLYDVVAWMNKISGQYEIQSFQILKDNSHIFPYDCIIVVREK